MPPSRDGLPRTALRLLLVGAGLVLLLVLLVAGCGSAPPPASAPAPTTTLAPATTIPSPTATPPTTTAAPPTTSGRANPERTAPRAAPAPAPAPPAPARPPAPTTPVAYWPAGSAAATGRLQRDVDGGQQPWTLDPVAVATSYAGAELGYRNPRVFPLRPGVVDVEDGRTPAKATITLTQAARRGDGGVWVVTGLQRR